MRSDKIKKPKFLKQILIIEISIFIILMMWYAYRISSIDSTYIETRLEEEIDQIEDALNMHLHDVNDSLNSISPNLLREKGEDEVFLKELSKKIDADKIKWVGASNDYYTNVNILELSKDFCGVDNELLSSSIISPSKIVISDKKNCGAYVPSAFSVLDKGGNYVGSFIILLNLSQIKEIIDEYLHIYGHPEISYIVFSKNADKNSGAIISYNYNEKEEGYLKRVLRKVNNEYDLTTYLPYWLLNYSYYVKTISIPWYEANIIMLINHKALLDNSVKRLSFVKIDFVFLAAICVILFLFIRYRFIFPVIRLSKAANKIESGSSDVYIKDYTNKELADLASSLRSLITKQHQLMDVRNKLWFALKQLDMVKQEKTDLLKNIQHIVRTPIGHILGAIDIIKNNNPSLIDRDNKEYFDIINIAANKLLKDANDIILSSEVEVGNVAINSEFCDIKKIVEEAIAPLMPIAGQSKIDVSINASNNLPAVDIDKEWFETAIFNIIDNAIKFGKSGGNVVVSIKHNPLGIKIMVKDDGLGIDGNKLDVINNLFKEGSINNIAYFKKGGSLGLTIAYHIIELHDSTLTVESKKGHGTKVTIIIPNIRIKSTD